MNFSPRRLIAIAGKEALHLLREPRTLIVVFLQPVMLLVLYGYCMSFDLHSLPFAVWDQDHSEASREMVARLNAGANERTFILVGYVRDAREVEPILQQGKARFVLVIPHGYERELDSGRPVTVQALFDAADSNTAGVAAGYLNGAISDQNVRIAAKAMALQHGISRGTREWTQSLGGASNGIEPLNVRWRVFYNPDLSSRRYIIPGLVAILLTIVAASLTSTSIVRERELGSLESLLTSPVSPVELVIGKLAPYTVVAAGNVTLVLLAGGLVFGVWPRGDLFTLASFSILFALGMLSLGMLISAASPNQQVALILATLATLLPNFFLTGFAFPRSNMPWVLQAISFPLPATQYLYALRAIFLKGAGWDTLWPQGLWMAITCAALVSRAVVIMRSAMARGLG